MLYLGVDGGGTKTDFMLINEKGNILAYNRQKTIDFLRTGRETFKRRFVQGINKLLSQAGVESKDIKYAFLGIPCYGDELKTQDEKEITEIIAEVLPERSYLLGNDVEASWAGSLACRPGINLVAGTGTIGFGRDERGQTARAGGWGHYFGDEGSAYWLGKKMINIFTREADGRESRSMIYEIIKQEFDLTNDFDILAIVNQEFIENRERVACLAPLLLEAAESGESKAIKLYQEAALELSLIITAILNKLKFKQKEIPVSYSGGVFKAGVYILKPLKKYVTGIVGKDLILKKPVLRPVTGACLYALYLDNSRIDLLKITEVLGEEESEVIS